MTTKRFPLRRGWCLAAIALPALLGAIAQDAATRAEHRAAIARLTAAERTRLEENFAAYRKLSEEERQRLRRLHQDLMADKSAGGQLDQTLVRYEEWLNTITPWQRMELRRERDTSARLALVTAIRGEQLAAEQQREWRGRSPFPGLRGPRLAEAVSLVEQSLPRDPELQSWLDEARGPERHIRVLTAALRRAVQSGRGTPVWPSEELTNRLIDNFADPFWRRWADVGSPEDRRWTAYRMLEHSITMAWWDERRPRDEAEWFVQTYEKLAPAERERIERMSQRERQREFWERFGREHRPAFDLQTEELKSLRDALFPNRPENWPFGDRGRGDGNERGPRGDGRDRDDRGHRGDRDDREARDD